MLHDTSPSSPNTFVRFIHWRSIYEPQISLVVELRASIQKSALFESQGVTPSS